MLPSNSGSLGRRAAWTIDGPGLFPHVFPFLAGMLHPKYSIASEMPMEEMPCSNAVPSALPT
jgi:hypothetical protein